MEFRTSKPIFRQIADHIIELIINGSWQSGDRIPSVRDLASEVEVNPNTVARTYNMLGDLNIIHTKRGVGYFLSPDASKLALKYMQLEFEKEELPRFMNYIKMLNVDPISIIEKYNEENKN